MIMTAEEMNNALYEKFSAEQDKYREWLLSQPPDEILNHTYEYTVREDILMMMDSAEFPERQAAALLREGVTLDDVYKAFTNVETEYMDILRTVMDYKAEDILRWENERKNTPVYPHSFEYAEQHGELQQYNYSYDANYECRKAIETAIAEHYGDNRLDTIAAVKQVTDIFGYDRTRYVLALTVQHKDFDGRISHDNKEWAKTVPVCEDMKGRSDRNAYLVVDKCNPGLTDLFLSQFRKDHAREQQAEKAIAKSARPSVLDMLKTAPARTSPNNSAKLKEPER